MKKKMIALLSLILALVMSFSLIACNDGNPSDTTPDGEQDGTEPTVVEMTEKAAKAIAEFVGSDVAKFTADVKLSSKSGTDTTSLSAEKSGNIVKAVLPVTGGDQVSQLAENQEKTQTVIVNLETGYAYTVKTIDGKLTVVDYVAALPAGLYDYVDYMLNSFTMGEVDYSALEEYATYDKDTSTVTLSHDVSEKINDFTDPLYRGYNAKQNLTWLIEEYLETLTDGQLGLKERGNLKIYNWVTGGVKSLQNQTIGTILEIAGIDSEEDIWNVAAMLENFGVKTTWEEVKKRKLGDIIIGAYNGINNVLNGGVEMQDEGEGDDMSAMYMQALYGAINGAFTYERQEGDPDASKVVTDLFDKLIEYLNTLKVDALIDQYVQPNVPELYAAIKNKVQITKAKVDLSVKLDENDKLDTVTFTAQMAHDYKADAIPEDYIFLADNDYNFTVSVKAVDMTASKIDTNFVYDASILQNATLQFPTALIYGEIKEDVKVYLDLAGADKKQGFKIVVVDDNGVKDRVATFDEKTSSIVFKARYIKEAIAASAYPYISVEVRVSYANSDGEDYPHITSRAYVSLIYLPDTVEGYGSFAESMIKDIIGGMIGGGAPETPDIGDVDEQLAA